MPPVQQQEVVEVCSVCFGTVLTFVINKVSKLFPRLSATQHSNVADHSTQNLLLPRLACVAVTIHDAER